MRGGGGGDLLGDLCPHVVLQSSHRLANLNTAQILQERERERVSE